MDRITMTTPLVEIDGDEMTRVLWQMIKEKLILPFVDLKTEYYDLGLLNRNDTDDSVTREAGEAAVRLGVAVKCAIAPETVVRSVCSWSFVSSRQSVISRSPPKARQKSSSVRRSLCGAS